jgi:hypothetical protein
VQLGFLHKKWVLHEMYLTAVLHKKGRGRKNAGEGVDNPDKKGGWPDGLERMYSRPG